MKVRDVLHHFEGKKIRLAEALDLSKQTVSNWRDEDIPRKHELELKYKILPALTTGRAEQAAA